MKGERRLLPSLDYQVSAIAPQLSPVGAEKSLLSCLLERAIMDLRGIDSQNKDPRPQVQAAYDWIFDDTCDDDVPFSFLWVCRELDIRPTPIRELCLKVYRGEISVDGYRGNRRRVTANK